MHSKNYIDLTGRRFSRLSVLSFAGRNENGNAMWLVRCDCGAEFVGLGSNIKRGMTRSCGCLRRGNKNAAKKAAR